MKKLALAVMLLLASGKVYADSWKELFKQTEGKVIDWAIASSVEPGYFRDMANGKNLVGAQFPAVYVTSYLTGDFGYITGYSDSETRGSLMFGGSLRLNRLIEDTFRDKVSVFQHFLPDGEKVWQKLWFGPWVSVRFSDVDEERLIYGIKAGLSFDGLFGW
jgi:hypothetical protein